MLEFDYGVAVDSAVGTRSSFVAVVGDDVIVRLVDVSVVKVEAVIVGVVRKFACVAVVHAAVEVYMNRNPSSLPQCR